MGRESAWADAGVSEAAYGEAGCETHPASFFLECVRRCGVTQEGNGERGRGRYWTPRSMFQIAGRRC